MISSGSSTGCVFTSSFCCECTSFSSRCFSISETLTTFGFSLSARSFSSFMAAVTMAFSSSSRSPDFVDSSKSANRLSVCLRTRSRISLRRLSSFSFFIRSHSAITSSMLSCPVICFSTFSDSGTTRLICPSYSWESISSYPDFLLKVRITPVLDMASRETGVTRGVTSACSSSTGRKAVRSAFFSASSETTSCTFTSEVLPKNTSSSACFRSSSVISFISSVS